MLSRTLQLKQHNTRQKKGREVLIGESKGAQARKARRRVLIMGKARAQTRRAHIINSYCKRLGHSIPLLW